MSVVPKHKIARLPKIASASDKSPYMVPMLSPRQRRKYRFAIGIWLVCIVFFWGWWLQPEHNISTLRYLLVSAGLGWLTFLQLYFLGIFLRAQRTANRLSDLDGCRVAMVVTKTPSEPFHVVRVTLEAMLAQDYVHDTWLADEIPDAETALWCADNGVFISTRENFPEYHQPVWPRRTRCKEGNLAFFYDQYGYEEYDFVAQLDADHVPSPTYLGEILKPFADCDVGYVSAPSICASNADNSWAARTRLFAEAMFHGVLQSGYSRGWAPMCIGSHYAVRTSALKEVGGLGPELAEDHSTSMIMNAGGWRGVHAVDAIAIGAGPANFADMVTQEFQWSRSLMTLLMQYTPKYFPKLRPILKFQFVFSQLWYPLFALFMMLMFLIPIYAIVFDARFANVTYPAFIGHALPATVVLIAIALMIRRDGFFRPHDAKVISWEKALFPCAQWPWVLWGCIMAIWDRLTGRFVDFRITPKGDAAVKVLPARVVAPYFVLALGSTLPVLLVSDLESTTGFYILALINAVLYTTLFLVIILDHFWSVRSNWRIQWISFSKNLAASMLLLALISSSIWLRGMESAYALTTGLEPLRLIKTQYLVAGAGQGARNKIRYIFDIEWK